MIKTLIMGVDVSKGYADFCTLGTDRVVLESGYQLTDNKEGHDEFRQRLTHWHKDLKYDRIMVAVESTGGYEDNWLHCLKCNSVCGFVEGYRINPKITHHEYRVQMRGSITDRVSAQTIAQHVAKNIDLYTPLQEDVSEDHSAARSLTRHIVTLEKHLVALKNGLEKLLYRHLPSYLQIKSSDWSKYYLQILLEYGTKKSIQRAASQGFKRIKFVPKGFADKAYNALLNGVDKTDTSPLAAIEMQSKAREILHLQAVKNGLVDQLVTLAPVDQEQLHLLCSIKGMGQRASTILLCFIGDVTRFTSAAKLSAFFGVVPRMKQSGDGAYKAHLSKQGNPLVRRELYLLAFRMLNNENYFRSIYEKHRQAGKSHNDALCILMHKILRVIYGMLKNGTEFDAGIDQLNQVKEQRQTNDSPQETPAEIEKMLKAPISARKRRTLKKGHESQAATVAECTGSS